MRENRTSLFQEFRVAPFGYGLIGLGLAEAAGIGLIDLTSHDADPGKTAARVAIAGGALVVQAVAGMILIGRQHHVKRRLEDSLERHGYDERVFSLTTDEWCNRQTARVVCEAAGALPEYEELCEARSDTAALTYIPHL